MMVRVHKTLKVKAESPPQTMMMMSLFRESLTQAFRPF
jgi:hypothetical protein